MTNVTINYSRDELLPDYSKAILQDRYLLEGETSPQDAFARAAATYASNPAHAQRIYDYASKLWFGFSTPILTNAGTKRGLPISCFLNYVDDSLEGITGHWVENVYLSTRGGGIGGYWGHLRSNGVATSKGSESSGVIPFIKTVDAQPDAFKQGRTRRGSYAAYLDISHPEIVSFVEMRKPTGGDLNRKCLNLHHGINITDDFMEAVEAGAEWSLVDPHTGTTTETLKARELWVKILETRHQTGEPYLHFIDTTNRALPEAQKKLGLKVHQSNLCSEITLPTNKDRTAVCCLSSVNLTTYNDWRNNSQFIPDLVEFLDNVLDSFAINAPKEMDKAVFSAMQERSIGIGAMGFHAHLQSKGVPIEGVMAKVINEEIFRNIKERCVDATRYLAKLKGECPDGEGTGVRNMHLMAIAPNANSGMICGGTSPSIEPFRANAFTQKTMSGNFLVKNPQLEKVLEGYGKNDSKTWSSIITNEGSVQHLEFMSEDDKEVFKTAMEIDQRILVDLAGDRQRHICQAQSLNIFLPSDVPIPTLHHVHFRAWKRGVKSLYYLRSEEVKGTEKVSTQIEREKLDDYESCLACEG